MYLNNLEDFTIVFLLRDSENIFVNQFTVENEILFHDKKGKFENNYVMIFLTYKTYIHCRVTF